MGISKQMRRSLRAVEMASVSVYGPRWVMTPEEARMETRTDCQKEKKRMPLTHMNLGTGLISIN